MIMMFRRTTWLYFGLIALGLLILSPFIAPNTRAGELLFLLDIKPMPPAVQLLVMLLLVLISRFIAIRYAIKLSTQINELCTKECDPYTYIDRYENVLRRAKGSVRKYVLVNLSFGYLQAGAPERAKQVLDSVGNFPRTKAWLPNTAVFWGNLCMYYLQINDMISAEIMLKNMMNILHDEKFPKRQYNIIEDRYTEKQCSINIAKGDCAGAEEVYLDKFDKASCMLDKVMSSYQLGKIYLQLNRLDEARAAFEYVAKNGNKTYYVHKSIEFLNQLA